MADVVECNVQTGAVTERQYTQEEQTANATAAAAAAAYNAPAVRAARHVDGIDRLQFEHLFDLENRMRVQEGLGSITRAQYRNALMNRYMELFP